MKYLGENFVKKIVDWIKGREVWTSGTGKGSVITVACKKSNGVDPKKGALGSYSYAEGYGTTASGTFSHAEGAYNVKDTHAIHSVGIGNDSISKNAEYIYIGTTELNGIDASDPKNGYKYLIGVGGYDGISTDNSKYKSVQEVIAELTAGVRKLQLPVTAVSGETVTMDANKAYEITAGETLTLTLAAAEDTTIVNEWQGTFDTGSTAPTVTWPSDVIWADTPTVKASTHYEFNIRYTGGKYYGLWQEWRLNTEEESV